jgi:hypothetical protein
MLTALMNPLNLSVDQLKRAAAIKQQVEQLNKELRAILGGPANSRNGPTKGRAMSAATKRKIAAAQKARWAKLRRGKSAS